ncbi:MAG: adenylyl-sulfate kinase [Oxalobacteraceae bacterium]|nr:MAG: adenylyl-sulfate kinase [Oxalobacteraceae bacterium]
MTPLTPSLSIRDEERRQRAGHGGAVVWITGLSGAGKTTLADALQRTLFDLGCQVFALDGDKVRNGLCADLGFSLPERSENIRRIGEVAHLFCQAGQIVIVSAISPMRADRARVRALVPAPQFIEVYCHCPLAVCEARDPKGLYRRARAGQLAEFTGISSPYKAPEAAEVVVDSAAVSVDDGVGKVLARLRQMKIIKAAQYQGE